MESKFLKIKRQLDQSFGKHLEFPKKFSSLTGIFGPNLFYEISVTFVENSVLLINGLVVSIN